MLRFLFLSAVAVEGISAAQSWEELATSLLGQLGSSGPLEDLLNREALMRTVYLNWLGLPGSAATLSGMVPQDRS